MDLNFESLAERCARALALAVLAGEGCWAPDSEEQQLRRALDALSSSPSATQRAALRAIQPNKMMNDSSLPAAWILPDGTIRPSDVPLVSTRALDVMEACADSNMVSQVAKSSRMESFCVAGKYQAGNAVFLHGVVDRDHGDVARWIHQKLISPGSRPLTRLSLIGANVDVSQAFFQSTSGEICCSLLVLELRRELLWNDICCRTSGPSNVTDSSLRTVLTSAQSLTALDISRAEQVTDATLELIAQQRPPLRTLAISHCHVSRAGLDVLKYLQDSLEELRAAHLFRFGGGQPHKFHIPFSRLRHLDVSGTRIDVQLQLFSSARSLQILDIAGTGTEFALDEFEFDSATGRWDQIQTVCLSGNSHLSESDLLSFLKGCPSVEHIELRGCPAVTDGVLVFLAERAPLLRSLDVSTASLVVDSAELLPFSPDSVTDHGVCSVVARCAVLQSLVLQGRRHVTSVSARAVRESLAPYFHLNMSFTGVTFIPRLCQVLNFSGTDIETVDIDSCASSTHLLLAHCKHLSVFPLGENLVELDLREVRPSLVTDERCARLLGAAPKLEVLKLRGAPLVTNITLQCIASTPRKLRCVVLDATAVQPVAEDFALFAWACPNLEVISFALCFRLDAAALRALISASPRLGRGGHVTLTGLPRQIVDELRDEFQTLKIYW
jgi:hypothetical protein